MKKLIVPLVTWWGDLLGAAGVVEDALATARDRRLNKANHKQLATSSRTAALTQASKGCTHLPPCPPASAPDRTRAAEIWSDTTVGTYLCNGIILATRQAQAPDSPSGLYTPMPQKEATP